MEKDKINIRQFKDKSSNFWCNNKHYFLDENNVLNFICGGKEDLKETETLEAYIKRNKKSFVARQESVLLQEAFEYKEVISFGKYSGKKLDEINDVKYLKWLLTNFNFGGKENLKKEITEILK